MRSSRSQPTFWSSSDRIEEHAQRLVGVRSAVHVSLLLAVIGLREQPTHQFDEHRHSIAREFQAEPVDLGHDKRVPTVSIEVVGQPARRCITLPDHLVPPP